MSGRRPGPMVARRQLRLKLRRGRLNEGKTQQDVARALDWSTSKVLRIENGDTAISVSDLIALLTEYPKLKPERDQLVELAKASKSPPIVDKYPDVIFGDFRQWLDHEAYADSIRQYEPTIVPGALQTNDYARAMAGSLLRGVEDDPETERAINRQRDRIVEARRDRIESLIRPGCPRMELIIDEAVIRRAVGNEDGTRGFSVMINQLEQLKRLNTIGRKELGETIEDDLNPQISLQIQPFEAGAYPIMRGPFEVIELAGGDEEDQFMMFLEDPESDVVLKDDFDAISKNLRIFDQLKKVIPGPAEANRHLDRVIEDMKRASES